MFAPLPEKTDKFDKKNIPFLYIFNMMNLVL